MADIVKTTTWLPDMSRYQDYARARAEAFPHGDSLQQHREQRARAPAASDRDSRRWLSSGAAEKR